MKLYWSDWTGHTLHLTVAQLLDILDHLELPNRAVRVLKRIPNSSDPAIHPTSSPPDQHDYDPEIHPPKPLMSFGRPVWGEIVVYVALRELTNWDEIIEARAESESWSPVDYDTGA